MSRDFDLGKMPSDKPQAKPSGMRPLRVGVRSSDILHFLHIPKTGGTSLYEILTRQFPDSAVFPRSERETLIDTLESSEPGGWQFRLTRMHHDYSIYRYFPRKPIFVTMLRNPIDRVVSLFGHIGRVVGHPLHLYLLDRRLDLNGFCLDPVIQPQIQNTQVRYLVGTSLDGPLSREAILGIAKIRLDEFAFFGLVERFPESAHLLFHTFGWPEVEYASLNVRPDPQLSMIKDSTRMLIEGLTELDQELYRYACELFDQRLRQMIAEKSREKQSARLVLRSLGLVARRHDALRRMTDPSRLQLSRWRRVLIPEGSSLEPVYFRVRNRLFGW